MNETNNNPNELQNNQKGISNTTIAVLIILALVISIIGTWAVLNSLNTQTNVRSGSNANTATVTLNVMPPDVRSATGRITFTLV
jgi:hypothetical protein